MTHAHSAGEPIGSTLIAHLRDQHDVDQGTLVMSPDWQSLHARLEHLSPELEPTPIYDQLKAEWRRIQLSPLF